VFIFICNRECVLLQDLDPDEFRGKLGGRWTCFAWGKARSFRALGRRTL
jgi:hypothetical protein